MPTIICIATYYTCYNTRTNQKCDMYLTLGSMSPILPDLVLASAHHFLFLRLGRESVPRVFLPPPSSASWTTCALSTRSHRFPRRHSLARWRSERPPYSAVGWRSERRSRLTWPPSCPRSREESTPHESARGSRRRS
jgi:hypothetical protein